MDVHFTNYLLPFFVRQEGGAARAPLTLRVEYQLGVTSSDIALYAYNRDLVSMSISFQY